jgi:hypothetical protein
MNFRLADQSLEKFRRERFSNIFERKDHASYSHRQEEEEGSYLRSQGEILSNSVDMSENWHTKSI